MPAPSGTCRPSTSTRTPPGPPATTGSSHPRPSSATPSWRGPHSTTSASTGCGCDRGPKVRLAVSRTMFGGEEWEFHRPLLIGDTVTAQRRLGAVEEKDGRSGPFVLIHYETTFTNQRDEVVAVSRLVGHRPMSAPRLAGDVVVGDELEPVVHNASRAQLFLYSAATHNPHRIHYDRDYAAIRGPSRRDRARPAPGGVAQPVRHRLGRAARAHAVAHVAEPALGGARARLRVPGRRCAASTSDVVQLEVWAEDGDGTVLMPGTATVRLPTA